MKNLHVAVAIEDCGWERDMHGYQIADLMTRVEFLLQPSIQSYLNAKDRAGITPLHLASAISDVNASILVNAGADVRAKDSQGRTPLHFVAEAGQSKALGFLIEIYEKSSFDIDYRTLKGRTALHYACRSGVAECVQLLLNAGANVASQ
ncbi:ankyrin repeat-containing domain protein [Penicillium verhagenii]|uniref:ankyrin repeat-containing domain protein n=1 Tax=Penicillium verhagenii TaxID=1562060 RepID=UPI002545647E|nr:ankyrin repeat-containing domain protein [Penicillium verhagenii]KAJ5919132.1 ankyrin repeat-containing domain protein [Penicillium verhagenii]